jgi:glycogen debranching enzyme
MNDAGDFIRWDEATQALIGKDSLNDWYVAWGAQVSASRHQTNSTPCIPPGHGKGRSGRLSYSLQLGPNQRVSIPIVIAGSYSSELAAKSTLQETLTDAIPLLKAKKKRYKELADHTKIHIPDKDLQQAFEWVKYNTDWLIRDVPETGRALSAGIPDYPWWFGCDNTYSLQGVLATGRPELVFSTLKLLKDLSEKTNGNGRIIHEASTNGVVFNPGNINETPHFISMVWKTFLWTGDLEFLKAYYPLAEQGLEWLQTQDTDGNYCPDGFGMMEIHGLDSEMIDVAVYTQQAFADASEMAAALGFEEASLDYAQIAEQLKITINEAFWVPEYQSYADFIGTTEEALHLIDDAIVRADTLNKPWAVKELQQTRAIVQTFPADEKRGFVLHHNWVVNTPMEAGIADPDKAIQALQTGSRFVNPFGMFVTGIDRDETAGTDLGSFAAKKDVFSYVGAVMTLPTGVQAIAENNYGRPDQALNYLKRMTRSFSYAHPGSMYEVSPDFGMVVQAWNVYALASPIITQFFGIQPEAHQQRTRIQPQMPSDWDKASIEQVQVGENILSMNYQRSGDTLMIKVDQSLSNWEIELALPANAYRQWTLNNKSKDPVKNDRGLDKLSATGSQLEFLLIQ